MAIGDRTAGRDKSDARLIAESGKIIDAGQAHYLPPRMLMMLAFRLVDALYFGNAPIKPPTEPPAIVYYGIFKKQKPLSASHREYGW